MKIDAATVALDSPPASQPHLQPQHQAATAAASLPSSSCAQGSSRPLLVLRALLGDMRYLDMRSTIAKHQVRP